MNPSDLDPRSEGPQEVSNDSTSRAPDSRSSGQVPFARSTATPFAQGAAGLGLTFAATAAAFALLGAWLDRKFESAPWFTLGCSLFGVVSGTVWLVVKASPRRR